MPTIHKLVCRKGRKTRYLSRKEQEHLARILVRCANIICDEYPENDERRKWGKIAEITAIKMQHGRVTCR
jgi:hypothetical protein